MNDENKIKRRCKNIQVTKNLGFAVIIIIIVKKFTAVFEHELSQGGV